MLTISNPDADGIVTVTQHAGQAGPHRVRHHSQEVAARVHTALERCSRRVAPPPAAAGDSGGRGHLQEGTSRHQRMRVRVPGALQRARIRRAVDSRARAQRLRLHSRVPRVSRGPRRAENARSTSPAPAPRCCRARRTFVIGAVTTSPTRSLRGCRRRALGVEPSRSRRVHREGGVAHLRACEGASGQAPDRAARRRGLRRDARRRAATSSSPTRRSPTRCCGGTHAGGCTRGCGCATATSPRRVTCTTRGTC